MIFRPKTWFRNTIKARSGRGFDDINQPIGSVLSISAIGDNELRVIDGCEAVSGAFLEHTGDVAAAVIAGEFEQAFLHCPQAGESDIGVGGFKNLPHLVIVHDACGDLLVVMVQRLDVDADGPVAHGTSHCGAAMAHAEVDVGVSGQGRLAVGVIGELRQLVDAIFRHQCPMQQPVGRHAQAPVALMAVTQGLLPPLGADSGQRLLQVKIIDMIVDVDHFFSSNWM